MANDKADKVRCDLETHEFDPPPIEYAIIASSVMLEENIRYFHFKHTIAVVETQS